MLTTTELRMTGVKNTLRSALYSQPRLSSMTATARPSTFGTTTTMTVRIVVTLSAVRNASSVNSNR
jgi:hypothetical protein